MAAKSGGRTAAGDKDERADDDAAATASEVYSYPAVAAAELPRKGDGRGESRAGGGRLALEVDRRWRRR